MNLSEYQDLPAYIQMGYAGISREFRENPNPVVKCGHVISASQKSEMFWLWSKPFDVVVNIYNEFYHIDPLSLVYYEDPCTWTLRIYFKAKSRVKPYKEVLEDEYQECLEYWIESLQASN